MFVVSDIVRVSGVVVSDIVILCYQESRFTS